MAARKTRAPKKRRTPLATLRGPVLKLTQVQVAELAGMFQTDVSRLERRPALDDVVIGTLRRYVEALGGELRLVAMVKTGTYELCGAEDRDAVS